MLSILADRTYRHLFLAQIVALLGAGLATIALGLLAYDLAGDRAALVLGAVFANKMIAYVGIAPIAGAFCKPLAAACDVGEPFACRSSARYGRSMS